MIRALLAGVLLLFPLIGQAQNVVADPLKIVGCQVVWTPSSSADLIGYTIEIADTDGNILNTNNYPESVNAVTCDTFLKERDHVVLSLYALDQSGNRSNGLKGLEVRILDLTGPLDPGEFCIEGMNEAGEQVRFCVQASAELKFMWDAVTTYANGNPIQVPVKYRLYQGLASRDYSDSYEAGEATEFVHTITRGPMHYFAVTARTNGNESGYSNEVTAQR